MVQTCRPLGGDPRRYAKVRLLQRLILLEAAWHSFLLQACAGFAEWPQLTGLSRTKDNQDRPSVTSEQ